MGCRVQLRIPLSCPGVCDRTGSALRPGSAPQPRVRVPQGHNRGIRVDRPTATLAFHDGGGEEQQASVWSSGSPTRAYPTRRIRLWLQSGPEGIAPVRAADFPSVSKRKWRRTQVWSKPLSCRTSLLTGNVSGNPPVFGRSFARDFAGMLHNSLGLAILDLVVNLLKKVHSNEAAGCIAAGPSGVVLE